MYENNDFCPGGNANPSLSQIFQLKEYLKQITKPNSLRGQPDSYQFCVYISIYLFVGDNGNDDEFFKRDWTAYTNGFGNPLLVMKNMVEPNAN